MSDADKRLEEARIHIRGAEKALFALTDAGPGGCYDDFNEDAKERFDEAFMLARKVRRLLR